ncbi:hypothetical protein CTZ27_01910 [Streptomyces griseocarneus]|nr:hypothetical protein CTZ27_01910 [Streptomyces griseocarneus]
MPAPRTRPPHRPLYRACRRHLGHPVSGLRRPLLRDRTVAGSGRHRARGRLPGGYQRGSAAERHGHRLRAGVPRPCRGSQPARPACTVASRPCLALTIGPEAAAWARAVLAPLRAYSAKRSQDPGGGELVATAASWPVFSSQATAHLKIHRNTLSARIELIGELLGLDLHRTLTACLRSDARPGPTAAALSLSVSATRKRLARIEALLECSLTRSPSVRHDLWPALRALELGEGRPGISPDRVTAPRF